jgi:Protein kinase domain/Domain of unknown function (DUF4384)
MSSLPSDDAPRTAPGTRSRDPAWAATEMIPRSRREPARGNALPVGTHLGEFELLRVLGEGGFGIVYLAQDHSLQRRVAIKEYMPSTLATRDGALDVVVTSEKHRPVFEAGMDSFINEARLLAQFDHPSLLKVYRFWQANGTAYMVMPFYEGVTLKERLRQMGSPPDERWLMALLASLTDALKIIHAEHCLHRDIAPDNILMLADSGRPLLLDFGAARQVIGDATQALTAILKPGYAPVEQYAEVPSLKQGPWTDVYALCAVVHGAMMGSKPPVSVARTVADSYVPLLRSAAGRYSPRFLQAIDDGLQVRPAERTPSMAALRQALGIDPGGPAAPAPGATGTPAGAAARAAAPAPARAVAPAVAGDGGSAGRAGPSRSLLIGGVALAVALAGGLAYWAGQRQSAPPAPAAAARPAADQPAGGSTAPVAGPALPAPSLTAAGPGGGTQATSPGSIDAEFDRVMQGRQSDFTVQAQAAQPRLRIGRDRLAFTVDSARDGHVYVLVGGPDGSLMLLFPNTQSSDNRIRAGKPLSLPQPGWPLDTFEPAGTEHFVVLVSEHPRDFSKISTGREDWFLKLPTGAAAVAAARGHTGAGSVLAGKARCTAPGCDVYGAARFAVDVVR